MERLATGFFDKPGVRHGYYSTYTAGCRCDVCKKEGSRYSKLAKDARFGATPRPENSVCQACDMEKVLVLDHDHETGLFRGWICQSCNTGIGKLGDSIEGLERALEYLRRSRDYATELSN